MRHSHCIGLIHHGHQQMLKLSAAVVVVIVAVLQVESTPTTLQGPLTTLQGALTTLQGHPTPKDNNFPAVCRKPPPGMNSTLPHTCCNIPSFFKDSDFEECGFEELDYESLRKLAEGPPDCTRQVCIFKKYNLISPGTEDTVHKESLKSFMDQYAVGYPTFARAVDVAKEECIDNPIPGPPHVCEPNRLVICVSHHMFTECPEWERTDNCVILRRHMEECKPFFSYYRRMDDQKRS